MATASTSQRDVPQKPKQPTFAQTLARYRELSDDKFCHKLKELVDGLEGKPGTIATYRCSLNGLLSALIGLGATRTQHATLGEGFLRPGPVNGAGLLKLVVPDSNKRSKIIAVLCRLAQVFPQLADADRQAILDYWRAALREAVANTKAQMDVFGFGGNKAALPDLQAVDCAIATLPPGDRNRLAIMLYRHLPLQHKAVDQVRTFWNLGAVRVIMPGTTEPSPSEMEAAADAYMDGPPGESETTLAAAGWLVLDGKTAQRDRMYLHEGVHVDSDEHVIVTYMLPKVISDELRCHYLAQRPGQQWLFVDLAHKNFAKAHPYLYEKGRDSFLKSINDRYVRPQLGTTLGAIKTAVVANRLQTEHASKATTHVQELKQGMTS